MEKRDANRNERSRKLAEALLKGWKMLPDTCPICDSPLFETPSGEVLCVVCGTKVILVESDEEAKLEEHRLALDKMLGDLVRYLERELYEAGETLDEDSLKRINMLLDAIRKTIIIRKNLAHQGKMRS